MVQIYQNLGVGNIPRKGIEIMNFYAQLQNKTLRKVAIAIFDIKAKEIQEALNISKSVVSRHICGERYYPPIDIFIIEKVFNITIKDYVINE